MVGDLNDFVLRLRAVLPKRWFAEQSPNLTHILTAIATPWTWLYETIGYVRNQTRLMTATDGSLDLISHDYFGFRFARKSGESDNSFRARIVAALAREAATRLAVSTELETLTGNRPQIFEPANCTDTGSYGGLTSDGIISGTGMVYGLSGGWGSLSLPYQFFATVSRPATPGIAMMAGYGTSNGGYGEGLISYIDLSLLPGQINDQDIQMALSSLLPVNAVAWMRII